SALDATTRHLGNFLRAHPDTPLADVAYTLALGRASFAHRRTVVASDTLDAAETLKGRNESSLPKRQALASARSTVFMFPGQGAQHVNMSRALYEEEAVFRQHVDAGAEVLRPVLGQ